LQKTDILFGTINTFQKIIKYHLQTVKNIQKAAIKMIHSKNILINIPEGKNASFVM
jgi:hypothetical protein